MKRNHKLIAIVLLSSAFLTDAVAQSSKSLVTPFRKGSVTLNLGLGLGTDYRNEFAKSSALATKAALEFGIWQAGPGVVSLGVEAGAMTSQKSKYNRDDFRASTIIIAGRSAWHYGWKVPGLDTYGGVSAGVGFHRSEWGNDDKYDEREVNPVFGGFVGVSYFFTPRFGVNAEAGFDITSIQGGVIFKFK